MSRARPAPPRFVTRAVWCERLDDTTRRPGDGRPVDLTLEWRAVDPCTVTLDFLTGRESVRWQLGRDLLAAGLTEPAGLGDVSMFPDLDHPGHVELILSPPTGLTGMRLRTTQLADFLTATWRITPAAAEAAVVAAALDRFEWVA